MFVGERSRYLIVYPFVKSTEWYLLPEEDRRRQMAEHIRIGRQYPQVQQLLAYSFGLDDQEFIVAYETDDLPAFFVNRVERELGVLYPWLPAGALNHDPHAYLKAEQPPAAAVAS